MRRTLWFDRFLSSWPVKRTCVYTYTHKWLVCMHSWGNWITLLCFGSLTPIVQSCEIYYTNLVENIHWTRLLWNSFMNGLLWINKDVWMIDGCWIWCNHDVVYFLLYLNCENVMKLLNYLVMLLVFIYVMCIYVAGEFSYMLLVLNFGESMYSYSRWKIWWMYA